jgi:AcrR family transcriptional regulator
MFISLYHEGYHACNLNDLLLRAGSSKGGLYHHFNSKKELTLESIKSVIGAFIEYFWKHGLEKNPDPIMAIETLLKELPYATILQNIPFEFKYGCPLNNMIQELSATDEDFSSLLLSLLNEWKNAIANAFERAKENQCIRKDVETQQLADFIIASIEGSITVAKARREESSYYGNIETLVTYLNTFRVLKKRSNPPQKYPVQQSLFQ